MRLIVVDVLLSTFVLTGFFCSDPPSPVVEYPLYEN